ncbi:MAG: VOC family protein [Actinomycetes bacterium]|jgi:catechol 2,3-dioxygenase-like lactoylglutathione lyase family enzyme|nr:VOC family protein [Actinomycetes bacterium]
MAKITGLGGVFYVSPDPEAARTWYREVLGVDGPYGPQFLWSDDRSEHAYSLMSAFPDDEYLKPSTHGFMVNFRVDDLDGFVEGLEAKGIEVLGTADEGYGKFAWVLDCDGLKVELWQQMAPPPPMPDAT